MHSPGTMHVSASARRASFAMSAVPFSFVWMPSGMKCAAHAGVRGRQPELDAARTPPSTSDDNEDDALALMALSRS